ncbi:hypothetical protein [Streptomyces sp. NBC_00203]|uniref:hypothetical protein n=1 Tax=Streptomyces sp. NBC_00203 TaxID=2975680 RepID=UPI003867BC59
MGQQGRRVVQGFAREARRPSAAYGFGGGAALQPGGDGRGEVVDFALGEKEAGVVAVQAGEERGGRAVAVQVGGVRYGESVTP